MKIIRGIKIGGLQQKIFNLILIFIVALIAAYNLVAAFQQRNLSDVVQRAGAEQQAAIKEVSDATMRAVLDNSTIRTTALQAYIANELFTDVQSDVLTLQACANEILAAGDEVPAHAWHGPDPADNGRTSVHVMHEEGVDPADSKTLGQLANMTELMYAMFDNSRVLNSCFVATADGCILFAHDRAGAYVTENGEVRSFPVRERPWYRQAVAAGGLIFTGVEEDAYTGITGLVCAAPVYRDGELTAVVGADVFLSSIRDYVQDTASEGSFLCVIGSDGKVLFSPAQSGIFRVEKSDTAQDLRKSDNAELASFISEALKGRTALKLIETEGKEYYVCGAPMETLGWTVVSVVSKSLTDQPTEMMLQRYDEINAGATAAYEVGRHHSLQTVLVLTGVLLALALISALVLARHVVRPLEQMTKRVRSLSGNDLRFEMEDAYRTGDEIEVLAESFANLSGRTLQYIDEVERITAEKERIGTELSLATRIQADMLPNVFPAFPERNEFDIYAVMDPARAVGGDFYDFFLLDHDHLCIVMADVSGKGVPAALFMMASKIILANNAIMGKSPAQILTDTNAAICANNREEMFVTVWIGILELSTGTLTAANAGHEYPAIQHADGSFELLKDKHGIVVGAMDGVRYKEYQIPLQPGERVFVYTDGVPEATNAHDELFGTDRMLDALNRELPASPKQILHNVREAVDDFVQDAEQFDDLTMLCLEYRGPDEESDPADAAPEA